VGPVIEDARSPRDRDVRLKLIVAGTDRDRETGRQETRELI
jgi:hypothetical protein